MNMTTKHEVAKSHLEDWLACRKDKKQRGEKARELAKVLKLHIKSVGRTMRRVQMKSATKEETRGRPVTFGTDVTAALYQVWDAMDYPSGENMTTTSIDTYIAAFVAEKKWNYGDDTTTQLLSMSEGTRKLRLRHLREKYHKGKGRCSTYSSPLKGMIPIRKSHTWHDLPPGHAQTDSVAFCGDILTGDIVYGVGCVDFATYWSEYNAQWNKGQEATCDSLKTLRARFPFPLRELHPDSGSEFINNHVIRWAHAESIELTRSEPYKKNDNMCIEERNNSIARRHLGYARLDRHEYTPIAAEILRIACLLHNHFKPVRRMTGKVREGAKWKRTFEKEALTPYERVMRSEYVSTADKEKVGAIHMTLNPLALRRELATLKAELGKKLKDRITN
jgi:hypothetical protein